MTRLIQKGVLLLVFATGTLLVYGQGYEQKSLDDEFRSSIEHHITRGDYLDGTNSVSNFSEYGKMDVFGKFLDYIKTEIEPKELINSSGKKSTIEATLLTGRNIYTELSIIESPELLNESYTSFLTNYISYLGTIGLSLDDQLVTQNLKKSALANVVYFNASYSTLIKEESEYLVFDNDYPFSFPPRFFATREVVINALAYNGFDLTQPVYTSKKFMNFYEMRLIESFEHAEIPENLTFLSYLMEYYPQDVELFGGRTIYTAAMYEATPPLLNPEYYQVMINSGFDPNLPCEVCSGLTPLIMLGNLPSVIPIYHTLSSKKYQKGKIGSAYSESFSYISAPYFQEGYFVAHEADLQVLAVAEVLVNNGAEVNFNQNDLGTTALHSAVSNAHVELVRYLLDNGADKNIEDKNGNTPIDLITDMQGWVLPVDEELAERIDAIIELLD